MIRSLRNQLLFGIAVATLVGFAATAAIIFVALRASLLREFDALLASKARALATLIEQKGHEIEIKFADHPMQEFARKIRPEYYQVWDEGASVVRSRRLETANLERIPGSLAAPGYRFTTLPDGRRGRSVGMQFLPAVEGETLDRAPENEAEGIDDDGHDQVDFSNRRRITLVVARETTGIDLTLSRLMWLLIGVSATATLTMLGVLGWLVRRRLRPLDQLAAQIADLNEHELASRFGVTGAPQELDPIVAQLNQLMARLETAFHRERVFTANIAHELRTPLSGLHSTLDVALSRIRSPADYRQALQECQDICHDTQRIVETLLSLVHIEMGRAEVDRSYVDVATLVARSWKPYEKRATAKRLGVVFDGPADILVDTDACKLRVVLANLFDNAVDYANSHGSIDVRWIADVGGLRLSVANTGCVLAEHQMEKVFDQFWRADKARSATGSHAGIGLALCRKIVHVLGGAICADRRDDRFVATIVFGPEFVERLPSGSPLDSDTLPAGLLSSAT